MTGAVYLVGAGAVTSVGIGLPAVMAALHAQINQFRQSARFPSVMTGQPLILARLESDDPDASDLTRLRQMALLAATECAAVIEGATPVPVFLSVPPERPGWGEAEIARLSGEILSMLPTPADVDRSRMVATGHHGGLAMMAEAAALIAQGEAQLCLVGGVESPGQPALDWLDRQGRLKGEDTPTGLVPGEGAGFVLLASEAFVAANPTLPHVVLQAAAQAEEPSPWYDGKPNTGDGLSQVLRQVLPTKDSRADVTYCDQNGETWRTEEWSTAYLRTGASHGHPLDLRHPADCWGDVGAASGPLLAAMAWSDLNDAPAEGPHSALVYCASDTNPFRSAVLLAKHGPTAKV